MTTKTRPPFAYYGGKTLLAPKIASLLPDHGHYVEPFAGSLAVLLAKAPSRQETVNDLDGDLIAFWRAVRDHTEELERACILTPYSRAELAAAYEPLDGLPDVERARRIWVRLTQSRLHTTKPGTEARWMTNREPRRLTAKTLEGQAARISVAAERLRHVALECRPALDVIKAFAHADDALLYVDPPYLGSTRTHRNYGVEMSSPTEHAELAEVLRGATATVVLSGYDSDDYHALFGGWFRHEFPGRATAAHGTRRTEVLWSNRPLTPEEDR